MGELLGLLKFGPAGWGDELARGALLTVELAAAVVPIGIVLGFLVALARDSKYHAVRIPANAFTTVFRGLPELLTLFIVYFGGQILFQKVVSLFTDTYVELSAFVAGLIALGMVFAAFAGEVFLGALRAVPKAQIETARALGLSEFMTLRLIILPQVIRYALPGLGNLWLSLLKDTSLVTRLAFARSFDFQVYLWAAILYLMMVETLRRLRDRLEKYLTRHLQQVGD
ncbi:MAG: hypothetical protein BMS9Abin01_0691 [Gammaproteobacteria bacterium]|nr:MAG: hypothetical protein BMS9Abin01_0691 [Gammaproteobacteria bacterium]